MAEEPLDDQARKTGEDEKNASKNDGEPEKAEEVKQDELLDDRFQATDN